MSKELRDAMDEIASVVGDVTGIRMSFGNPPDSIGAFPAAIVYVMAGEWQYGPTGGATKKGLHTIGLEIHHQRERLDLARAAADAIDYAESVPDALMDDATLSGTVDLITAIRYRFAANAAYGSTNTMAWFYEIDVKIENSIT